MPTYGEVSALRRQVVAAIGRDYTLRFAKELNRRMIALETAMALQQGVDWENEPRGMLLVVRADTPLDETSAKLFDELCVWLAGQGFTLEKSV